MVAITYHTTGAWGAGIAVNLTAAQVDTNFYNLSVAVEDLIANPPAPNSITSISADGLTYVFHFSDTSTITLPIPFVSQVRRGEWLPLTAYAALDTVLVAGLGGFVAMLAHTSPAVFDAAQMIGAEAVWLQEFMEAPASLLSGLSDVDFTPPPTDGQILRYEDADGKWHPADPTAATAFAGLTDVTLTSLANNDFVAYASGASEWTNRTPAATTALLATMVGDSGSGGTKGLAPAPAAGDAAAGKFLKADGTYAVPAGGGSGIDQLTGDVTAGPGSGSQAATLANTAVTPGSYTNTNLTVDAKGRITAASNGSGGGGGGGLFNQVLSATPTIASTGLGSLAGTSAAAVDMATGVLITGGAGGGVAYSASVPSTPYTITALLACAQATAVAAIGWTDLTKYQFIYVARITTVKDKVNVQGNSTLSVFGANQHNVDWGLNGSLVWLRVADDGTNVTFSVSADGVNFFTAYTVAKASGYLGASGYSHLFVGSPGGAGDVSILSWAQG